VVAARSRLGWQVTVLSLFFYRKLPQKPAIPRKTKYLRREEFGEGKTRWFSTADPPPWDFGAARER
jgi:hypothetical protein